MINLLQHPTFILANDIADICKPLNLIQIDTFSHVKIEQNKNFSFICNNPRFIEHYFKKKYFNYDIHTAVDDLGKYVIWDDVPRNGKTLEMEFDIIPFGVKHTFTIIQKNNSCLEFYHFSSSVDTKTINQSYLKNLDLLMLFISHFKKTIQEAKKLRSAYDFKFSIDEDKEGFSIEKNNIFASNNRDQFKSSLSIPSLSVREKECLNYVVLGKTAKEIGVFLGISFRTVETHLENIKLKFGVASKSQLIEKWMQLYKLVDY